MSFAPCEICGADKWVSVYRGPIRDGIFGSLRDDAQVCRCGGCGAERLDESVCPPDSFYESEAYREKLAKGLNSDTYFAEHDELQMHTLRAIWPTNLRSATVADIGCGGGSLLDHVRGWSARQVAVEPYATYRDGLAARGYATYPYAKDAVLDWAGRIDLAFSIQVIEHTANPRAFLEQIRPLLSADGRLVISMPNRKDILFDMLPEDFPSFFYRVVHRWYFDVESLSACARLAGFTVEQVRPVHRYSMGNALRWLRDRKPTGNAPMESVLPIVDSFWAGYLEQTGKSDCIYLALSVNPGA